MIHLHVAKGNGIICGEIDARYLLRVLVGVRGLDEADNRQGVRERWVWLTRQHIDAWNVHHTIVRRSTASSASDVSVTPVIRPSTSICQQMTVRLKSGVACQIKPKAEAVRFFRIELRIAGLRQAKGVRVRHISIVAMLGTEICIGFTVDSRGLHSRWSASRRLR